MICTINSVFTHLLSELVFNLQLLLPVIIPLYVHFLAHSVSLFTLRLVLEKSKGPQCLYRLIMLLVFSLPDDCVTQYTHMKLEVCFVFI